MRGILFGLLFANLLYLGWDYMLERREPELIAREPMGVVDSNLVLVSEAAPEALRYYPQSGPETAILQSGGIEDNVSSAQYCAEIGPFSDLADAEGFIVTNDSRFTMTPEVRKLPASPDYRVYLPPFASRELAASTMLALREAFAANDLAIDSFLITRGEFENGIALGLFSEQRNALNVQAQMERLGYRVVIAEDEKFREEIWVLASGLESEAEFAAHWAEIQLSRSYIGAGEKLCETIAHGL